MMGAQQALLVGIAVTNRGHSKHSGGHCTHKNVGITLTFCGHYTHDCSTFSASNLLQKLGFS